MSKNNEDFSFVFFSKAAMYDPTGGIDGKFRHFEQDGEFKLQLNLNHGLKFPLSGDPAVNGGSAAMAVGSLYGRLHNHANRGTLYPPHVHTRSF